jgi:serine phosphatase RsbU (regulator of sigma subunit)
MLVQVAAAKAPKYATSESGDTLEMVERPNGGLSFVLADGQRSGQSAKLISNLVTHKAIALLAEGVRDGAAARAAHDYLFMQRRGKVSATLNIVSIDLETKTLVISRNSHCPALVQMDAETQMVLDAPSRPVGVYRQTKPHITELPVQVGMAAVVYTDGLHLAGERAGAPLDVPAALAALYREYAPARQVARPIADALLAEALARDDGRAADDISVLVLAITPNQDSDVRRLSVELPIPPLLRP